MPLAPPVFTPDEGLLHERTVKSVRRQNYPSRGQDKPIGMQEVEAPRISRQSAHEGGKVVSPTHRPSLPLGKIAGTRLILHER